MTYLIPVLMTYLIPVLMSTDERRLPWMVSDVIAPLIRYEASLDTLAYP